MTVLDQTATCTGTLQGAYLAAIPKATGLDGYVCEIHYDPAEIGTDGGGLSGVGLFDWYGNAL